MMFISFSKKAYFFLVLLVVVTILPRFAYAGATTNLTFWDNFDNLVAGTTLSGVHDWLYTQSGGCPNYTVQVGGDANDIYNNCSGGSYTSNKLVFASTTYRDVRLKFDFKYQSQNRVFAHLRQPTTASNSVSSYVFYTYDGGPYLAQMNAGGGVNAFGSGSVSMSAGTWYTMELESIDNGSSDPVLSAWLYAKGTTRPGSPTVTYTDTSHLQGTSPGYVSISLDGNAGTPTEIDNVELYTGDAGKPTAAPYPLGSVSNLAAGTATLTTIPVTWSAPTHDGGSAVVDYLIEYRTGSNSYATFSHAPSTSTSTTITGLNPGTSYNIRVSAVTGVATSTASSITASTVAYPNISNIFVTQVSTTGALITFTTDLQTSDLINYGLTTGYGSATAEANTSPRVTSHSVTLSGLTPCKTYNYDIYVNGANSNATTSPNYRFITQGCSNVIVDDNFTRANTSYNSTASSTSGVGVPTIYNSPSTGGGWIDNYGNHWKINLNTLLFKFDTLASVSIAELYRPDTEATVNQKVQVYTSAIGSTGTNYIVLRRRPVSGGSVYAAFGPSVGGIRFRYIDPVYKFDTAFADLEQSNFTFTSGHSYVYTAYAVSPVVGHTKFVATIADALDPTTILNALWMDDTDVPASGQFNSSGTIGVTGDWNYALASSTRIIYSQVQASNLKSYPLLMGANTTGNVITLKNTGADWTPGTPGTPTFSVSGVSGVSITSQTVVSTSTAKLTLSAGANYGTLIITDGGSNATTTVDVVNLSSASTSPYTPETFQSDSGTTTAIFTSEAAVGGVAPYTYQWQRATLQDFTDAVNISGATSLTLTDTPPTTSAYYYRLKTTDSATVPNIGYSFPAPGVSGYKVAPPNPTFMIAANNNLPQTLKVIYVGDSITNKIASTLDQIMGTALAATSIAYTGHNLGSDGSSASDWVPGFFRYDAMATDLTSNGYKYVFVMFGTNEAIGSVSAASYKSSVTTLANRIIALGGVPILNSPNYQYSRSTNDRLLGYTNALDQIADGSSIFRGDRSVVAYFADKLYDMFASQFVDTLHPNATQGYESFARYQVDAFLRVLDGIYPTLSSLSSVASSTTSSSISFTWATNASSSTYAQFGPSSSNLATSTEIDTGTRVRSHSMSLSNIQPCTQYYVQLFSRDANGNRVNSTPSTITTPGCTGSATVSTSTLSSITTASGGSLSFGTLALTVPTSYASSTPSAIFQAKTLDSTAFYQSAGTPTSKTAVGTTVYNLKALADATTTIPAFDAPLTVRLSYSPSDVTGLTEGTLKIYRYDGATWSALSGCVVDTNAHTVTCTTTRFSDFAIFGDTVSSSPSTSPAASINTGATYGGGSTSAGSVIDINKLNAGTNLVLVSPKNSTPTSQYQFTKTLTLYTRSVSVKELQKYLNSHGFIIAKSGSGSPGKETDLFGVGTKNALIKFQKAHKISPTGQLGPITRLIMNSR